MRDTDLREAAGLIDRAERIVIFTGAGVSAESGIPTFRDALSGLWERFDPRRLATPEAFGDDPALVWGWYEWRRAAVERVGPNAGHRALAAIEQRAPECVVVTQNVDDLHERAGSKQPIHLHGSLFAPRCSACARAATVATGAPVVEGRVTPPPCDHCGAPIRPGVVWFGEALPGDAFEAAVAAAANCDVLITVGTSGGLPGGRDPSGDGPDGWRGDPDQPVADAARRHRPGKSARPGGRGTPRADGRVRLCRCG